MKEIDFKKDIEAMKYFANKNAVSVFDIVHKECRVKEEDLRREGIMVDMLNQEIEELQRAKQIEEMAKKFCPKYENERCDKIYICEFNCEICKFIESMFKDSVVLSADEFANLKKYAYKKGSKETTEKIMQDLKPLLEGFVHTDTGENLYVYKCKQFGVEIKE